MDFFLSLSMNKSGIGIGLGLGAQEDMGLALLGTEKVYSISNNSSIISLCL